MQAVSQRVAGRLIAQDKRTALLLREVKPSPEATDLLYLRYPFITKGPGDHIFPAFILDDWGREIRSLKLYQWVREFGERFPRAEIFGFEQDGRDTQCFLRELELYARLPCYAYQSANQPVDEGAKISAVLIPDLAIAKPKRIKPPTEIIRPMLSAQMNWWNYPPNTEIFDLIDLGLEVDPGY